MGSDRLKMINVDKCGEKSYTLSWWKTIKGWFFIRHWMCSNF